MKHPMTRELFAYWNERRGTRPAPERHEIEPGAIRNVLAHSFILTLGLGHELEFRLAGTRLCALFCRELKSSSFVELWQEAERAEIRELGMTVALEAVGVVAGVAGTTSEGRVELELLLLPLYHRGQLDQRLIGLLAPLAAPHWLGLEPVRALSLGARRYLGPAAACAVDPEETAGPGIAALRGVTIYDGGRS
ncbi:MAG TPA: PAS domain-containing protein [Xanthobacteraceae bacterium]